MEKKLSTVPPIDNIRAFGYNIDRWQDYLPQKNKHMNYLDTLFDADYAIKFKMAQLERSQVTVGELLENNK